ncbi:MAG TPA: DUF202 domain-containing protein [archaeon]|uniref:DUF202 domain-containing protein n=1 Tax=Candidatus Colwellbacteria bacterium RIFCSPLOWO2_12_FULL_44_13 TaxID=1797694 RepID=A0A1G1ZAX9_9BACT|nr:MAG: hypothetical protein A3H06_01660 [Candidatus Colwellbacteria bacterium RIFCSPLOWO2_12_FULL_44_13]HLC76740.1 DUF202 domain-containing protein [archaeon]
MPKKSNKRLLIAEEEVVLSKERTILSFMRTAMALIGAGVVIASILQDVIFKLVGYGLIVLGFIELVDSMRRLREKQKLVKRLQRQTGV